MHQGNSKTSTRCPFYGFGSLIMSFTRSFERDWQRITISSELSHYSHFALFSTCQEMRVSKLKLKEIAQKFSLTVFPPFVNGYEGNLKWKKHTQAIAAFKHLFGSALLQGLVAAPGDLQGRPGHGAGAFPSLGIFEGDHPRAQGTFPGEGAQGLLGSGTRMTGRDLREVATEIRTFRSATFLQQNGSSSGSNQT